MSPRKSNDSERNGRKGKKNNAYMDEIRARIC